MAISKVDSHHASSSGRVKESTARRNTAHDEAKAQGRKEAAKKAEAKSEANKKLDVQA